MSLVVWPLDYETDKTYKQVEDKQGRSHTFTSHTSAWRGALLSTRASLLQRSGSLNVLSTTAIVYHTVFAISTASVLIQHARTMPAFRRGGPGSIPGQSMWICGGQSGTGTIFPRVLRFSPVNFKPSVLH